MSKRRATLAPLVTILLAALSAPANALDAGNKEAVRLLANEGANDFDAQRYAQALDKFERAYAMAQVPTLALWLAQTQVKMGQLVAALESYRQVLNLQSNELWVGSVQQQAQEQAQRELTELQKRVPMLRIVVKGADAAQVDVYAGGVLLPKPLVGIDRPVDPGTLEVVAKKSGIEVREEARLREGERTELVLTIAPPKSDNNPVVAAGASARSSNDNPEPGNRGAQRTWGWVGLGVGVAGLAVGATTGILVALKYRTLSDQCSNRKCEPEQWSAVDGYATLRTVSTVGFVVGAVGTVAGMTLIATSPKASSPATVALGISPSAAYLEGSF